MNKHKLDEEILKNVGGKTANNLINILQDFNDTDFEIQTYNESPYVDIDNLPITLKPHSSNFSILNINIQIINAKFDKLTVLLTSLSENGFNFSAICIQESWLKQEQDTSLFQIAGYNLIHKGNICSEHGGLIIYLKDHFNYKIRNLYQVCGKAYSLMSI